MDINHNQVVYIPNGEHDDPHELPQQQDLEGSTEIKHTLYSHTDSISPKIHFKSLNIFTSIFKTTKRYMNQILMQLGMKLTTLYTHILTMILNMVYLKMLSIVII